MQAQPEYTLVKLVNGAHSVHSLAHCETFHPVIGPVAEAQALYVRQLDLVQRVAHHRGQFVIWDVGLGAAANALTVLRATRELSCSIRLLSFDQTVEPLRFALPHAHALGYFHGYEQHLRTLVHLADFPALLTRTVSQLPDRLLPAPHAILYDPYSPAKNPAMWTQPLFANLFRLLDPRRPCAMPTYSRATMLRVSLLLAGFFVGAGHATGEKEETTIAANTLDLLTEPLDQRWLQRARNSTSAEPLWEPLYRQARLSPAAWEKLQAHPQFTEFHRQSPKSG